MQQPSTRQSVPFFRHLMGEAVQGRWLELRKIFTEQETAEKLGLEYPKHRAVSQWFDNGKDFMAALRNQPKGWNYYFGVHPRDEKKGRRESVSVVTCVHADLDFKDFEGGFEEVQAKLKDFDLPVSVVVKTGNGVHAYWILQEPYELKSDKQKARFETVVAGLQEKLGADDTHDLPRILRIPGTLNWKKPEPVPCEVIFSDYDRVYEITDFSRFAQYAESRMEAHRTPAGKIDGEIKRGNRNQVLASLAGSMQNRGMTPTAIEAALLEENKRCNPPLDEAEVRAIVKSISRYEAKGEPKQGPEVELVRVSDVAPRDVKFLWWPYIPLEMLTLIDGDPGVGKSFLTLALACSISLGKGLPSGHIGEPRNVLILTEEDSIDHTIRPRLDAMNADVSRVFVIPRKFDLDEEGVKVLVRRIQEVEATVVFIDPVTTYLGESLDMNRSNEAGPSMSRLHASAREIGCAIVGIRHVTKNTDKKVKRIHKGLGSISMIGTARSGLSVEEDVDEDSQDKWLIHAKHNLTAPGPPMIYQIRHGKFVWKTDDGYFLPDGSKYRVPAGEEVFL